MSNPTHFPAAPTVSIATARTGASGKINALAVSSRERLKVLPNVPTLDEAGVKGFESYNWLGMIAPASAPDAVVAKLNAAVEYAVTRPDVQKLFADRNIETRASKPEEMAKLIRDEMAQWGEVVKRSNIRMD